MELIYNFCFCGIFGWIIEVLFTGFKSIIEGNWRATCQTYLWMAPIYGAGGVTIKLVHDNLHPTGNIYLDTVLLAIFLYVPIFYGFEFLSGLTSKKFFGRVLWDYGPGRFTPMGLINFKYAPFWLALALFVHPIIIYMGKFFNFLDKVQ